jgi:hypothetical protein
LESPELQIPTRTRKNNRGRRLAVVGCLWFCGGCGIHRQAAAEAVVREYVRLVVALGEHDPDWLDYYDGPPEWVADVRRHPPSLRQIKDAAGVLIVRLQSKDQPLPVPRAEFLTKQLVALQVRADLLAGIRRSFDQEAEAFFGVKVPPLQDGERFAAIRAELGRLLPGSTPLARRYAAFDQKFSIPPERLQAVIDRAINGCRTRTLRRMSLPAGEQVRVEYVSDKPWSAYSFYQGGFHSLIQINTDFPLTIDRALQLACHEAYPGHHAYNAIEEAVLVRDRGMAEFTVQPAFSPQSFVSEAMATVAAEVAFPWTERLAFERDQLFPLAGLDGSQAEHYLRIERLVDELQLAQVPIARLYLDGDLDFVRAARALEEQALMVHSEATLKYLNEYRTYMLCYTLGRHWLEMDLSVPPRREDHDQDLWQRYREWIARQPSSPGIPDPLPYSGAGR